MEVVKYLKEKGWQTLSEELSIEVREYENGFRVLNYSQIDSPKMHPVVQECRGLILDVDHNIICRPFKRFLNYGEGDTKTFDFSDVTVYEKADGSMVKVYWNPHGSKWEIGTRGTAFAEANHVFGLKTDWTFREAILDAMNFSEEQFQTCMSQMSREHTYIFEYVSPYNRIVTPYERPMVVLLACIRNDNGEELTFSQLHKEVGYFLFSKGMNLRVATVYDVKGSDAIVALAESLPNLQEGFVVYNNKSGERIKIKSSVYCAIHHLRGNGSPTRNSLIELVLKNEQDELLTYFPEYKDFVTPVEEALSKLLQDAEELYNKHKDIEVQKDFALAVKDSPVSPICFKSRKDRVTIHESFYSLPFNQQEKLLERYLPE